MKKNSSIGRLATEAVEFMQFDYDLPGITTAIDTTVIPLYPATTPDYSSVPVPSPAPPPSPSQVSVSGIIYDQKGTPLSGVTIALIKDGKMISEPFLLSGSSYNAFTILDPSQVFVVFKKKGYSDVMMSIDSLWNNPDITMKKGSDIPIWAIIAIIAAVAIYRKNTKKIGKLESKDVFPIFLIIGGGIALVVIIKVLEKLGLLGGAKKKHEQDDPNSAFRPDYWQRFTNYSYAITESTAGELAKTIYNSFTVFQDNYNQILGVFKQMRTKANVSFLAWKFQKQYNTDLLTFLSDGGGILPWDGLSNEHMSELIDLVNNLPNS